MITPDAVSTSAYQSRVCPACGSAQSEVRMTAGDYMLGLEGEFYVSGCSKCGLLFQNPSLRPEFLGKHYPDDYAPYAVRDIHLGKAASWHLKNRQGYADVVAPATVEPLKRSWGRLQAGTLLIPDFVPDGKVFEIACASGNRLSLLRKLGWKECVGNEYSADSAKHARERGFTVHTGRVEECIDAVPDSSQDAILAGFVLEHLENPFQLSHRIADKLRPGGQYLFSTLNIDSPDFRMYREFWYDLDLPRHFTFFRKQDVLSMLKGRFKVEGITYEPAANDYLGSAGYRVKQRRGRLIDKLILGLGNRSQPLFAALALMGQASRICIHARKV